MKAFSMTDIGRRRETNQDYIYASENAVGNLPNLFIVADGMGGHNAGDFASRYTVEKVVEAIAISDLSEPIALFAEALRIVNRSLLLVSQGKPHLQGTGTTFVAASIAKGHMSVANVGDSRLYVVSSRIVQVTKDHSLVQEMVRMGEMLPEEAKVHPDKNIITRAVGAARDIEVDFFEVDLKQKDRVLLCSDGLTNMLEDEQIQEIISMEAEEEGLAGGVRRLILAANENGGRDNISAILIDPFLGEVI